MIDDIDRTDELLELEAEDARRAAAAANGQHPDDPGPKLSEPPPHQVAAVNHSGQVRIAYRLAKRYKNRLLHVYGLGWHYWDGRRWAPDDIGAARRAVLDVLRIALAASLGDKELRVDVRRCESGPGVSGALAIASALQEFAVTVDDLDADPWLLNCANGTLDLRTMGLSDHNPADRITKMCRAAYHENPPSTGAWREFLEKVLPEKDVRDYLQRLMGVALLGKVIEHVLPILTGTGFNGKSKFYEAMLWALGDYGLPAEPDLFMHHPGAHPTGESDLMGRRLVAVTETEEGRQLAVATMKRLTGGDRIRTRRMHTNFFDFTPSHLALLITNHLPVVAGGGASVWGRIRVIPFDVFIPEDDRDHTLGDKLAADADAVLAWAVDGWRDYTTHGLNAPESVLVATDEYRIDSDVVGRFIAEMCVVSPGVYSTTGPLFTAWKRWAVAEGLPEIGVGVFGKALDGHGYPQGARTRAGRLRWGLALRSEDG